MYSNGPYTGTSQLAQPMRPKGDFKKVQWAKQAGCHVIGTCSTEEKVNFLKKGVDVIYESIGGDIFETCVVRDRAHSVVNIYFQTLGAMVTYQVSKSSLHVASTETTQSADDERKTSKVPETENRYSGITGEHAEGLTAV